MKVSFDFDGTLDKPSVQEYCKSLIDSGIEVWICTARVPSEMAVSIHWNDDLYRVCENVGIIREHVKFCAYEDKYHFFKDSDFLWHLDDDWVELEMINKYTKTKGISVFGQRNWINKCDKLIEKFKNKKPD